jgi:hypothetical protein
MMLQVVKLYGTCDASGDLSITHGIPILGKLVKIRWIDGTFADGVDVVFTVDSADGMSPDETLLTLTDANSDAAYWPRTPVQDAVGADVTYDGTNEIYGKFVIDGKLKMVVSSGGVTKAGGALVYIEV